MHDRQSHAPVSALADDIVLVRHVELRSQLCCVILILEKHRVGSAERALLSPELASALAETWPVAVIVADAPQGLIVRQLAGVPVRDGWLDLLEPLFTGP